MTYVILNEQVNNSSLKFLGFCKQMACFKSALIDLETHRKDEGDKAEEISQNKNEYTGSVGAVPKKARILKASVQAHFIRKDNKCYLPVKAAQVYSLIYFTVND